MVRRNKVDRTKDLLDHLYQGMSPDTARGSFLDAVLSVTPSTKDEGPTFRTYKASSVEFTINGETFKNVDLDVEVTVTQETRPPVRGPAHAVVDDPWDPMPSAAAGSRIHQALEDWFTQTMPPRGDMNCRCTPIPEPDRYVTPAPDWRTRVPRTPKEPVGERRGDQAKVMVKGPDGAWRVPEGDGQAYCGRKFG